MKSSILAFALGALAWSSTVCFAQEPAEGLASAGPPWLKCCKCVDGKPSVPALDLSTGQAGPVKWTVNGNPSFVTSANAGWLTAPPAQWVQPANSPTPKAVGAGPFTYTTTFSVPKCAVPFTKVLVSGKFAADNGGKIWLDNQPATSCPGPTCFVAGKAFSFSPAANPNPHTLKVAVTNQKNSVSGLLVSAKLTGSCPACPPPVAGACCEPKSGSGSDCTNPIMNLGHPQDVNNPLGHTFGKARCEAFNDGQGGCAWNAAKPGCKISGPPPLAGPCCEPKPGSGTDCSPSFMNLGHPQDVGNPLGHTFGKARCEAINDGNGGCAWNAAAPECKISSAPPLAGPCCVPKAGSASDCTNPIMNLGHPQDVNNPLGHTFGKGRCEGFNDGNGGCAWDASKAGCKVQ